MSLLSEVPVPQLVEHHLALPPWGYGVVALVVFLGLGLVTLAFRSVGTRH